MHNDHSFVNKRTALVEILPVGNLLLQAGAKEAEQLCHLCAAAGDSDAIAHELGRLNDTAN